NAIAVKSVRTLRGNVSPSTKLIAQYSDSGSSTRNRSVVLDTRCTPTRVAAGNTPATADANAVSAAARALLATERIGSRLTVSTSSVNSPVSASYTPLTASRIGARFAASTSAGSR